MKNAASFVVLTNSVLVNPLTSTSSKSTIDWVECMLYEYLDGRYEQLLCDSDNTELIKLNDQFNNVLQNDLCGSNTKEVVDEGELEGKKLLQQSILSAWSEEESTTGRTPTNSAAGMKSSLDDALLMELPSLKNLLKAMWRVQRGVDEYTNSMDASTSSDQGDVCKKVGDGSNKGKMLYEGGPCGYVFRRGDIAWNCRTCQTVTSK